MKQLLLYVCKLLTVRQHLLAVDTAQQASATQPARQSTCTEVTSLLLTAKWLALIAGFTLGMCGNRISVRFLKTRTEPKPKGQTRNFSFPGFSQNRTCLIQIVNIWAILTKALTFFTLRTLSDSKWSWNQIISRHHAIIQLMLYSTG